MKHAASRGLHAYWDRLRNGRAAPERNDLEPGAIPGLLGDVFLLELGVARPIMLRLAGTRLCALFGRELRGASLESLIAPEDRSEFSTLIEEVADSAVPLLAGLVGETADGQGLDLELIVLPLRHRGRTHARLIGALAALDVPYWVGTVPLKRLRLVSVRRLQPDLAGVEPEAGVTRPRPLGRLRVLPGGRA